jgi:hypothetical protein
MILQRFGVLGVTAAIVVLTAAACGEDDDQAPVATPVMDPGDGGGYAPQIDPANFVEVIDNPLMPLPVGGRWQYEGETDEGTETVDVVVTGDRKTVIGVSTFVIRDTVRLDGEVIEDTYDWFAQDSDGNVWYFGESSSDFEEGELVSTHGSWEAGVDGAQPGIVMPAEPAVGDVIRQEYDAGEAEDMMQIFELDQQIAVPAGDFDGVLVTRDWNPLEPETVERKYYAPGVGMIKEAVEGGAESTELVSYELPDGT